jgi:uncharacterized protein (DUF1697 family)
MTFIALLRGVNVGGARKIAMADLRAFAEGLGFDDVRTLLQSGNLVFRSPARKTADLERRLETEAKTRLGLETHFLVRTADEWRRVVARNPLADAARRDPARFALVCLKDAPAAAKVEALQAAVPGPETIRADGRHLYIAYPMGMGTSWLTNARIEARLGTRGTARNWNTVMKLAALAGA